MLMIGKALGFGLEYYGFRLERKFKLSNQKFGSWLWDEFKGFLVGWCWADLVELLYFTHPAISATLVAHRLGPVPGLFVLMAQLAPVVLFPIFYKFEPLDNEELQPPAGGAE